MIFNGNKVWFTSDTHYNHSNICKTTTQWNIDEISEGHLGYRNFNSLEEMNNCLVNTINKYVGEDDILFHLGDFSFGGIEYIFEFRKRINCKNIYLILGNHDHHIEKNKPLPEHQQNESKEYINCKNSITSTRLSTTQDLFLDVFHVKEIKVQFNKSKKAIPIFLSHYSHRIWNKHHKGYLHLFGHSHGSLDYFPNGKSIDVGIDCSNKRFNEYRPFSAMEAIKICNEQDIQKIDHHV